MSWGEVASAELQSKAIGTRSRIAERGDKPAIAGAATETADRLIKRGPVVLDMGEASREQGFRLNGCR